jgi:hypothetical protein
MKTITLLFTVILFAGISAYSQTHITTNLRQEGKFNKLTKVYDSAFKDNKESTVFEFDRDFTVLKHTAINKTTWYLIKSLKKDTQSGCWEFDILSERGFSYFMIIDILNGNIRFVYRASNETYMAQYSIDRLWVDKN